MGIMCQKFLHEVINYYYLSQACVVEIGEYKNNIKKGNWSYAFEN